MALYKFRIIIIIIIRVPSTKQSHLLPSVQSQHLSLNANNARMPDEADAKKILTTSPGKLEETTGTSSYNVVEDHSAGPKIEKPLHE